MRLTGLWPTGPLRDDGSTGGLARTFQAAIQPLLFGLRLWASVCLALYLAFWLELDNASWAATSAAIVCQPSLGASLRKGWFRLVGTVVGAVAIVLLSVGFVQDRGPYLIGLALWCGAAGFLATLLRNFAAYAAALAGYTALIIASDDLGATGGPQGNVFLLAIERGSEICLGIICAGMVLAATDFGGARRRLALLFGAISSEIADRLAATLLLFLREQEATRAIRRDLVRRVIALDPVIDEAIGEVSDLRYHTPVLHSAVGGLFAALSAWRVVAVHLEVTPGDRVRREAESVHRRIPPELLSESPQDRPGSGGVSPWTDDPSRLYQICSEAIRSLAAVPLSTPSLQLLADRTSSALIGVQRALTGLILLTNPERRVRSRGSAQWGPPDWLPAFVNAGRTVVTIVVVELFWIVTAWPNGALAVTFAGIGALLFSAQGDRAHALAMLFLVGTVLTAVLAAIVKFAILPGLETFAALSLAMGLVLVPAGALVAWPWQPAVFTAVTINFIPLLAPANQMTFNTLDFYNTAMAIVAGIAAAALAFQLLPPLSPGFRTRRLLAMTLRDMRRQTAGRIPRTAGPWENRTFRRLSQLPEQADPEQRAQLVAALTVGTAIIRIRRAAWRFGLNAELQDALDALAHGDSAGARERLAVLDRLLAEIPDERPGARVRLRMRARILSVSEALAQYSDYFDARA